MTPPTTSTISKRLEKVLQNATPQELARVMMDLDAKIMEKVLKDHQWGDQKIQDQMRYIRDTYISKLSPGGVSQYRTALSELKSIYFSYRIICAEVLKIETMIRHYEFFNVVMGLAEDGITVARGQLGEDLDLPEDLESSPLREAALLLKDTCPGVERNLRNLIKRRAEFANSSAWGKYGYPCPIDPIYSSDFTVLQARLGKPVMGSKELPLTPEQIAEAETPTPPKKTSRGTAKKPVKKA